MKLSMIVLIVLLALVAAFAVQNPGNHHRAVPAPLR